MLNSLRKSASGILVKLFLGLLVLSFAVWGIQDIFSGRVDTTVATVGDISISDQSFDQTYRRNMRFLQTQQGRAITNEEARLFGIDQQIINQMVNDAALDIEASRLGIAASDKAVLQLLHNDERFFGMSGRFDATVLLQILQANGISESAFLAEQKANLRREQIAISIMSLGLAPRSIVNALHRAANEQRVAEYFVITPAMAGDVPTPTDAQVKKFYDERKDLYVIPEYRTVSMLSMRAEDFVNDVALSEDELKAEYQRRLNEFVTGETRVVDQLPFRTDAAAKAAAKELAGGKSFDALAASLGYKLEEISLGAVSRDQMMSPALAEAAFSLAAGKVSAPVEGPLGPVLLRVREIQPGKKVDFGDVRETLKKDASLEAARNKLYELSTSVEDARGEGADLREISERFRLSLRRIDAIDAQGMTPQGDVVTDLPHGSKTVQEIFSADVGDELPMSETPEGVFYWLEIESLKPARRQPFAQVREDARARVLAEARAARVAARAAQLTEKGNKGASITSLAQEAGTSVRLSEPILRTAADDIFSPEALGAFFAAPAEKFVQGPSGSEGARVVMRVQSIRVSEPTAETPGIREAHNQLAIDMNNDLLQQYLSALREREGVKVHQGTVDRVLGATSDTSGN